MNRFLLYTGALVALVVALAVQCEALGKASNLKKILNASLARLSPEHKRELETFVAAVERTNELLIMESRAKMGALGYLDTKESEVTYTSDRREKLLELLEASCRSLSANLNEFNRIDKFPFVEVSRSSSIAKWRLASGACREFLANCTSNGTDWYNFDDDDSCYKQLRVPPKPF